MRELESLTYTTLKYKQHIQSVTLLLTIVVIHLELCEIGSKDSVALLHAVGQRLKIARQP